MNVRECVRVCLRVCAHSMLNNEFDVKFCHWTEKLRVRHTHTIQHKEKQWNQKIEINVNKSVFSMFALKSFFLSVKLPCRYVLYYIKYMRTWAQTIEITATTIKRDIHHTNISVETQTRALTHTSDDKRKL